MSRIVTVGAAQMGPIQRDDSRDTVVERLVTLLRQGWDNGCDLVVFPELALTTFFPRWFVEDIAEADHWYETAMPNDATAPLFEEARQLGIGFCLGYAELTEPDADGVRHATTHPGAGREGRQHRRPLPQGAHPRSRAPRTGPSLPARRALLLRARPEGFGVWRAFGGIVGMMICNDRRWPESYRVMGLQGSS